MWRQGDLLIKKVDALPKDVKARGGTVLAEGEATGHKHKLTTGALFESPQGALFFTLDAPAELVHEEHNTLTFEPGTYEVVRQREYNPLDRGALRVND